MKHYNIKKIKGEDAYKIVFTGKIEEDTVKSWTQKKLELLGIDTKEYKRCYKCKKLIKKHLFNKNKSTADGLSYSCRDCAKKDPSKQKRKRKNKILNTKRKIIEDEIGYRLEPPLNKKERVSYGVLKEWGFDIEKYSYCPNCGYVLLFENFHKSSYTSKGITGSCKACTNLRRRSSKSILKDPHLQMRLLKTDRLEYLRIKANTLMKKQKEEGKNDHNEIDAEVFDNSYCEKTLLQELNITLD